MSIEARNRSGQAQKKYHLRDSGRVQIILARQEVPDPTIFRSNQVFLYIQDRSIRLTRPVPSLSMCRTHSMNNFLKSSVYGEKEIICRNFNC